MYGTNVYDIRSEFRRTRLLFLKILFGLIGLAALFVVAKELMGIPFDFIQLSLNNVMHSGASNGVDFKDVVLSNSLVQSVVVFITGLVGVFIRFADEIKQIVSNQWK